jgi:hypothetical protein
VDNRESTWQSQSSCLSEVEQQESRRDCFACNARIEMTK